MLDSDRKFLIDQIDKQLLTPLKEIDEVFYNLALETSGGNDFLFIAFVMSTKCVESIFRLFLTNVFYNRDVGVITNKEAEIIFDNVKSVIENRITASSINMLKDFCEYYMNHQAMPGKNAITETKNRFPETADILDEKISRMKSELRALNGPKDQATLGR